MLLKCLVEILRAIVRADYAMKRCVELSEVQGLVLKKRFGKKKKEIESLGWFLSRRFVFPCPK